MKCSDWKQLVNAVFIFQIAKSGHQPFKHVVYHETRYESYEKTNNQSQIDKRKKEKLDLYWLIVLVTMTTPTSSHVKIKIITLQRGEEKIF